VLNGTAPAEIHRLHQAESRAVPLLDAAVLIAGAVFAY
jgi:hypothetical protein